LLEQGPIQFARGPEVDIFDGGPDVAHAGLEAPGIAAGDLAVDEQAKPFGVTQIGARHGRSDRWRDMARCLVSARR